MLSAARSLIFPSFLKKSTKSTKAHLQSQEYSFWLFLARLSDLYCGNSSKKRFLTSLNVKNFFFISKSLFVCCLYYCNIRAKLAKSHPVFKPFHRLGYASAYHTCSSFSLPKMPYHSSSDNRLNNFSAFSLHGL